MFDQQCDFGAVRDCISGVRTADEESLSSIAILSERLERLKKSSNLFAGISFSQEAEDFVACEAMTALC
jgi:hypothetical protein